MSPVVANHFLPWTGTPFGKQSHLALRPTVLLDSRHRLPTCALTLPAHQEAMVSLTDTQREAKGAKLLSKNARVRGDHLGPISGLPVRWKTMKMPTMRGNVENPRIARISLEIRSEQEDYGGRSRSYTSTTARGTSAQILRTTSCTSTQIFGIMAFTSGRYIYQQSLGSCFRAFDFPY